MTEIRQVYKCNICGNIVEVLHDGVGELVCCGEPMNLLTEKSEDAGLEKHVPVLEKVGDQVKVKVGSIPHPMEPNHYIEWIEIVADDKICRAFLKPNRLPPWLHGTHPEWRRRLSELELVTMKQG